MTTAASPSTSSISLNTSQHESEPSTTNLINLQPEPWQPQQVLPDCWNPAKLTQLHKRAPLLFFGYPLSTAQLHDYAVAHDFYPWELEKASNSVGLATISVMTGVLIGLQEACGAYLYRARPYVPGVPNIHTMVALYSNISYEDERYVKRDEEAIIRLLQRELGITHPPMWYWAAVQEDQREWPRARHA